MRLAPILFSVASLSIGLIAQIIPGNSIATSINGGNTAPGEGTIWSIDNTARTATKLTISAALQADRPNCVTMLNGVAGYVGTNPLPANTPGNLYSIVVAGGAVTETKLNTTATAGGNVAQIALVGTDLWFTTQNATGTGGILQKVPAAGGPVTTVLDVSTLSGYTGLANALCAIGTKVYIGNFDSGAVATTPGCVVVYDTVANTGSVLATLPQGKYISGTTTFNTGLVHMQAVAGKLHLIGVYGDYLIMDTAGTVLSHVFSGSGTATAAVANLTNSGDYDPKTGDMILGSRDGAIDRVVSGQGAEKVIINVGTNATAANNSTTGFAHIPATTAAKDESVGGAGCATNGGFYLTDVPSGLPSAGNANYGVGCYSGTGGDLVAGLLTVAPQVPPLDLTPFGMAGCNLHLASILVTVPGTLTGTGNGLGQFSFGLPVPASGSGAVLYRQWAEIQVTKTNTLGIVVSNARKMTIL